MAMTTHPLLVEWSKLPVDLLSSVYERLSFVDFVRARTVCSSWYSVPKRKNHVPWLFFKQDMDWKLFDPDEGKVYITQISRLGFADCHSLATCGRWVLIRDNVFFYIINPFTLEIINDLPHLTSHGISLEHCPLHLSYGFGSNRYIYAYNEVLWVDERNKDYLVAWISSGRHLRFCMKGDEKWSATNLDLGEDEYVVHMVYKDKKLYILTANDRIKILDFSQDFLREVSFNYPYINQHFMDLIKEDTKMRLTTSGDVLLIRCYWDRVGRKEQFKVYKVNSTTEEWEMVKLLDGEDALVWDFCDYYWDFDDDCHDSESSLNVSTYKFLTDEMERVGDLLRGSEKQWLLPSFGFEE